MCVSQYKCVFECANLQVDTLNYIVIINIECTNAVNLFQVARPNSQVGAQHYKSTPLDSSLHHSVRRPIRHLGHTCTNTSVQCFLLESKNVIDKNKE